jgi:peptidyl-prolyl cis-trans isomerase SurA
VKRLLALVTVLVPLAALAELVDRIAAVIDNDVITQSEVEVRAAPELARLRPDPDPAKRGEKRQEILKHARGPSAG